MKTEPTDLDREAARLFVPAPRMRAWFAEPGAPECACTVLEAETRANEWNPGKPRVWVAWEGRNGSCAWVWREWLTAIAADDPPTIGAMQAQVEAAAGCEVKLADSWSGSISQPPDRWIVRRRCTSGQSSCDRCAEIGNGGRTRGEALISARRALKGTSTP